MLQNIISGMKAYFGVFELISKLKLWKYFIIPMIISVVTATIIGFSAYGLSDNIGNFITKIWVWDFGKETFNFISNFIGGLIILILGLIVYKHVVLAFSAPFMSTVSEKIEIHVNGSLKHTHRKTSFLEQLFRGIRINFRNLLKELILTVPILLLKFIPVVNIFSTILLFLVQAYYAGFGNMDYTLERHLNYKESLKFVGNRKGFAIGNGIVFMLVLLLPVIGVILVLPLSVTAASKHTVQFLHKENKLRQ